MGGEGSGRKPDPVKLLTAKGNANTATATMGGQPLNLPNFSGIQRHIDTHNIQAGGPAGLDTQIQFNDGGTAFGGDTGFTYNKTTDSATLLGTLTAEHLVSTDDADVNDVLTVGSLVTDTGGITLLAGQDIKPSANSTTAINIAQADGTNFVTFDSTNKRVGIGTVPTVPLDVSGSAKVTYFGNVVDIGTVSEALKATGSGYTAEFASGSRGCAFYANDGLGNTVLFGDGTVALQLTGDQTITKGLFVNTSEGNFNFWVHGDTDSYLIFADADTDKVGFGTESPAEKVEINGNLFLRDNNKAIFGTGKDASIYYNGTDMYFNSREVGTGNFKFSGGDLYTVSGRGYFGGGIELQGTGGIAHMSLLVAGINQGRWTAIVDDGWHFAPRGTDGTANNNIIFTTYDNYAKDHDHDTLSADPTLFIHSNTDPDTNNTQWISITHDRTNGLINTGTGGIRPVSRLILPMGEVAYFDTTGTTITISGTSDGSTNMVVVNPTTALSSGQYEFDNGGSNNGRLRYTGSTTRHFHVACTISIASAAANDVFVFGVAKNGAVISASKVLMKVQGSGDTVSTALHVMTDLATNDYLELYVGNTTDTDNLVVKTLNLFALGM